MASGADSAPWEAPEVGAVLTRVEAAAYLGRNSSIAPESMLVLAPGEPAPEPAAFKQRLREEEDPQALLAINRAGIYRAATEGAAPLPLFAANLNSPRESDIAPAKQAPIESQTPLPEVEEGMRFSSEPWLLLAIFAALLLSAEWLLFHRRWVE